MPSPLMLFAGGRVGDFVVNGGIGEANPGAPWYDTTYSDCATTLGASVTATCNFTDASGAAVTVGVGYTVNAHAYMGYSRGLVAGVLMTFYNASNQPWLRINCPSNGITQLQYNSNTGASPTWTNLGGTQSTGTGDVDLSLKIDASNTHTVLFAIAGTTVYTGTFTNANLTATSIAYFTILNTDPGGTLYMSQVMGSRDIGLVLGKLKTLRATGAGTYSQWTGAYTDVNEVLTNDATYNSVTTNDQLQSYNMTDITVPSQYAIASVMHRFRIRNDGTASPLNVQGIARSGGADYLTANLSPVVAAYGYVGTRYDTDPATGVAWTQSGVNALQLGFKSIA